MDEALELEAPIRGWVTEVAAEQIFVAPLTGKNGTIGALAVDNRRGGASFSSDDRALLEGLADHAVVAIENARMVEDLRRTREQIVRADRLGTLGTLAAGLAHEINNPLVSIHTFMSMAPSNFGATITNSPARRSIEFGGWSTRCGGSVEAAVPQAATVTPWWRWIPGIFSMKSCGYSIARPARQRFTSASKRLPISPRSSRSVITSSRSS